MDREQGLPAAPVTGRVLALESATAQCSVALLDGSRLLQKIAPAGSRNSECMLPLVSSLLAEAGLGLRQLDAIAFGAGPGAFTGLRVACGVAQGLALGADLPVVPVGTLEALAETVHPWPAAPQPGVLVLLDARMEECYWGRLERRGQDWQMIEGPLLGAAAALPLPPGPGWAAAGDGFAVYQEALRERLAGWCTPGPDDARAPEAAAVARLGRLRWQAGQSLPAEAAQPVYVRDKVALTSRERGAS